MPRRPIAFCCTRLHEYTIRSYVDHVPDLPFTLRVVHYENIKPAPRAEHHIFSDLERVRPHGLNVLAKLWNDLESTGVQRLNHPYRVMRRPELLRALRESGINDFDAWRLSEHRAPRRYPVFLRDTRDHSGALTELLHSREELDAAMREKVDGKLLRDHVLVIEFMDTIDAGGVYRKYSAFNIGGELFPVHIQQSRKWVVKTADIATDETLREELEYLDTFPQADHVREVFRVAGIDFGRIDFGLKDGRPQVWEINTNPHLLAATGQNPLRAAVRERFVKNFTTAMDRLAQR